jgi:hypothetical protein
MTYTFLSMVIMTVLLSGCGKKDQGFVVLSGNLEPKQAAVIGSLLDALHEKSRMTVTGKTLTIEVPRDRIELLKHYMTAPVDSESHIRLIRSALFADRDSAKAVAGVPSKKAERFIKLVAPREGQTDSLRIGAAFDRLFQNTEWRCYRTPDFKIHVEFSGTIPQNIHADKEGLRIIEELVARREMLLLDIGPEDSLWRFRWLIGIEGRSFKKESFRVIPGRFSPEAGKPPREKEYISL